MNKKIKVLAAFLVVLIIVKHFFIDYYVVDSDSMLNTLKPNSILFINKISNKIKRNDVVVFYSDIYKSKLVKRVVALPNDTFHLKKSKTFINNKFVKDLPNYCFDYFYTDSVLKLQSVKTLPNSVIKTIKKKFKKIITTKKVNENNWTLDDFGPIWIPQKGKTIFMDSLNYKTYKNVIFLENKKLDSSKVINKNYKFKQNYYFVLGDNRHHSRDSRYFGFISKKNILGKMIYNF